MSNALKEIARRLPRSDVGLIDAIAEAADVNVRTVRRWLTGESPIPEGIWAELEDLTIYTTKK